MSFERARSAEQKQQRIDSLMRAVERLSAARDYHEISLADIAKEAKFTRSNLYKYFSTKEDIFLLFIGRYISIWAADVSSALLPFETLTPEEFAEIWMETILKHKELLGFMPLLFSLLEKKATENVLAEFKAQLFHDQMELAKIINRLFPAIEAEEFLTTAISLASGLFPMANAYRQHKEFIVGNNIPHIKIDYQDIYRKTLITLIKSG